MKILLIASLLFSTHSFAKSKKRRDRPASDVNNKGELSFIDYQSEMWDYGVDSDLTPLEQLPKAFYNLKGFIPSDSEVSELSSSAHYFNTSIKDPLAPLLGFAPLLKKNKLIGVRLDKRYLRWSLNNPQRDQYLLRPKGRHTFSVTFSDGSSNLDNYFLYEEYKHPKLAYAAKMVRQNFFLSPVLKKDEGNDYIIGGATVDENSNGGRPGTYVRSSGFGLSIDATGFKIGAWNTKTGNLKPLKIEAFDIPSGHAVTNIGKYSQFYEKVHGQEDTIFSFLKQLEPIQKSIYQNSTQETSFAIAAINYKDFPIIGYKAQITENSPPLSAKHLDRENSFQQKNDLHRAGLNSILVIEDIASQNYIQNLCHSISRELNLSQRIAPKCSIMASPEQGEFLFGGNHIFITAGTIRNIPSRNVLESKLLKLFAHIELNHSLNKIPFNKNIIENGMPLAIAGNYFSYVRLIEGHQKLFIKSWFPQYTFSPKAYDQLGHTLIAQSLLAAAANFSKDQELEAINFARKQYPRNRFNLSASSSIEFQRLKSFLSR